MIHRRGLKRGGETGDEDENCVGGESSNSNSPRGLALGSPSSEEPAGGNRRSSPARCRKRKRPVSFSRQAKAFTAQNKLLVLVCLAFVGLPLFVLLSNLLAEIGAVVSQKIQTWRQKQLLVLNQRASFAVMPFGRSGRVAIARPHPLRDKSRATMPHYDGLNIRSLGRQGGSYFAREVPADANEVFLEKYERYMKKMNKEAGRQLLTRREPYRLLHYDELPFPMEGECIRPKWSFVVFPSCNSFHEITMDRAEGPEQSFDYRFLGSGTFRQAFLLDDKQLGAQYVIKLNRFLKEKMDFGDYAFSQVQLEAMIMLELEGPRSMTIYGHCATSVLVERGFSLGETIIKDSNWRYFDQKKVDAEQVDGVKPRNDLVPKEKLRLSLAMAESIAYMHNNPKGAIAHHDISFEQWLWDKSHRLRLNDFNKGRILPWNQQERRYCTFWSNQDSVYRAPGQLAQDVLVVVSCSFSFEHLTIIHALPSTFSQRRCTEVRQTKLPIFPLSARYFTQS